MRESERIEEICKKLREFEGLKGGYGERGSGVFEFLEREKGEG